MYVYTFIYLYLFIYLFILIFIHLFYLFINVSIYLLIFGYVFIIMYPARLRTSTARRWWSAQEFRGGQTLAKAKKKKTRSHPKKGALIIRIGFCGFLIIV